MTGSLIATFPRLARRNPEDDDELIEATKAANVTINREFSYLRAAFYYGMEEQTPPKVLQIPHFPTEPEDNARQGFLEDAGYERLRDSFSESGVQLLFIVAFNVGVRSKELRLIHWNQVNVDDGVIDVLKTKNGKARVVPIFNGDMMEYLKAAKRQRDELYPNSPWVFNRMGEPIKYFRDAWEKACIAAGFSEERHGEKTATLLFHDLRRTAVRNMVRKHGLDRTIAKKISGHLTDSMFDRYNIIEVDDIKAAKKQVDDRSARNVRSGSVFRSVAALVNCVAKALG